MCVSSVVGKKGRMMKNKSLDSGLSAIDIQDELLKLTKTLGRIPSGTEFYEKTDVTREMVRQEFVRYTDLIDDTVSTYPEKFKRVFTPLDFTEDKHTSFEERWHKSKKKHVLAFTAVPGAEVNKRLLSTFINLAQSMNAEIVCLVTKGDKLQLDPTLKENGIHILCHEFYANKNLRFIPVETTATSMNPAKALNRNTGASGGSLVVPSPRQVLNLIPNLDKLPRATISTGAVTKPAYNQSISGWRGKDSHFYGGYLFKIIDDNIFIPYNIDSLPNKEVIHLGVMYYPNGKKRNLSKSEIWRVDGDDHAMIRSKTYTKVSKEIQKKIPASVKISHDTWDMNVSNHHAMDNLIHKSKMSDNNEDRIEVERKITKDFLKQETDLFDEVYCVVSNHNDALARYNKRGGYMFEPQNWKLGHILALAQHSSIDPVEFSINHYDNFSKMIQEFFESVKSGVSKNLSTKTQNAIKNLHFLKPGEILKFGGFKLNFHGDEGAGGSKGTADSMKVIHSGESSSYGEGIITGHTHSPYKNNRSIVVGTATSLPHEDESPGYVKHKPNAWLNSMALVYQPKEYKRKKMGSAQLLIMIDENY
jgi:hypothetical protein